MWIFVLILLERQSRQFLNYFANLLHFHDTFRNTFKHFFLGYICKRENVKGNGCCKINVGENIATQRYSCDKCHNASGCCSVYENCISCCMHPLNVSLNLLIP